MKINSICLENYKIFYGKNILRFDNGVNIIEGKNGYGKTTIVDSIFFAFYGQKRGNIINNFAKINNEKCCRVSVDFEHNGDRYKVERELSDDNEKFYLKINNNESNISIENIIPERIASLSFFDGERISGIVGYMDDESLDEMLGIAGLKNVKNDVEKLKERFEKSLTGVEKIKNFFRKIGEIKELKKLEEKEKKIKMKISLEEKRINEINYEISETERILEKEKKLDEEAEERKKLEKRYNELVDKEEKFKENIVYIILKDELKKAVKNINKKKDEIVKARIKQGRINAQQELLKSILHGGRCICGTPVSTSNYGKHEISLLLENLNDEEEKIGKIKDFYIGSDDLSSALEKVKINISPLIIKDEKEKIEVTLNKKYPPSKIDVVLKSVNEKKVEKKARELRAEDLKSELTDIKGMIEEKREKIKINKKWKMLKKIRNAEKIVSALDEIIDETKMMKKREMEKKASFILRSVTNKPKEYKNVDVENRNIKNVKTELSDGEKHILALSLLGGIKKDMIIIDAPFTRLDPIHKRKLLKKIPSLAEQVILLDTEVDEIKNLTKKVYHLKHDQERRVSVIT
jgi:DNA sulfur modification protein DndD